jgi:membrane associated rhomboid family serine protease
MNFFTKIADTFRQQGVLTQIIVINAAVFLTVNLVGNLSHLNLLDYTALPVGGTAFLFRFWTLFTYMFTHADFWHLFWNMILFYFLSQVFFIIFQQRRMLYVYVMSGLAGGALVLIMGLLFPASFGNSVLLGASAAVLGVGAVMAIYTPDYRVNLFGVFEMAYKYFFILVFVLNTIIDLSINTGGKISHMGGTAFGLLYGYYLKSGRDLFNFSFARKKKSKLKVVHTNPSPSSSPAYKQGNDEQRMNTLLDKISKSGYDSLTKSEKEELFKLSQKK